MSDHAAATRARPGKPRRFFVPLAVLAAVAGFGVPLLVAPDAHAAPPPLRDLATPRGFLIGAAVANSPLSNEAIYRSTLAAEFNAVTAENSMKWDTIQPNPGQFNFGPADAIVNFAQANGQTVHGHTFVWHSQAPGWIQSLPATELRTAMQQHINTVARRYAGQVSAWDVVNEVFEENGQLRNSFWLQRLGSGYIAEAFRAARQADPAARLYINDFNVENINAKSDAMFNLVSSLRQQGVPIDGVGFQGHLTLGQNLSSFAQNLARFAALGVDIKITELDIRMQLPADSTKLAQQATDYRRVFDACLAVTRCRGITTWGFTDLHSWVPGFFSGQGAALIFDENYNAKPAHAAIQAAFGIGPGDTTPPTRPGTPTASNISSTGATLTWAPSTDTGGSGLAGYQVFREAGTTDVLVGQPTAATFGVTGLSPSTQYQFYVVARDGAGNLSQASLPVTFTTAGGGPGGCRVAYVAENWGGGNGFTASVTITNNGTSQINGWNLAWSFGAGQRVTQMWNATFVQPAATVTATNMSYNAVIGPNGGTTNFGFNGSWSGSNPAPTAFTLNGVACS